MEDAYAPAVAGEARNARESVAALEFLLRFTSLLTVCTLRSAGVDESGPGRSPGYRFWEETLEALGRDTRAVAVNGPTVARVRAAVASLVSLHSEGPGRAVPFEKFKLLRDHLSHAGPVGSDWDKLVDGPVRKLWDIVAECLADARIEIEPGSPEGRPVLVHGNDRVNLFPFFYTAKDGTWQVFSGYSNKKPSFMSFGTSHKTLTDAVSADTARRLESLLRKPGTHDAARNAFSRHVLKDLTSFKEKHSPLEVEDAPPSLGGSGFVVTWSQAVSKGTDVRSDHFRIGPDNRWEWSSGNDTWVSYSTFLRTIANLPVAARRLQWVMDELEERLRTEEKEQLGWESEVVLRPATVVVKDAIVQKSGQQPPEAEDFNALIAAVDEQSGAKREQTLLYFINGEAGIGKTRAMLTAARARAAELGASSDAGDIDRPLLLYIQSSGRVLKGLTEAVNNATSETRNLTSEVVKTLCRNGVIALLVDGFDELLGGAGFDDAVGDLRPWLKDLEGRGVLVVSARSSYYENQFRESLRKADQDHATVHHQIAEMQKWRRGEIRSFLTENGVPASRLSGISSEDWELLGLPFFARSFVELVRQGGDLPGSSSDLMGHLVESYLVREENKLRDPSNSNAPMLSRKQIGQVFENVVDFMVGNKEREVDLDSLEWSAGIVLGVDDPEELQNDYAHLRKRLSVLCGMTAENLAGDEAGRRFRFQHELFFDYFLAGLVIGHVQRGETGSFNRLLQAVEWRSAMTRRVASEIGSDELYQALRECDPSLADRGSEVGREMAARNRGSLWLASMRATGRVAEVDIKDATFADPVDLSQATAVRTRFAGCFLRALTLPSGRNWNVSLADTSIRVLTVPQACTDLSGLQGVRHHDIRELHLVGRASYYRRPEILDALRRFHAGVTDAGVQESVTPVAVDASVYFLRYIDYSMIGPMTLQAGNYHPDDQRLKWVLEYEGEWKPFVDALLQASLATVENLSASGNRKVRLKLKIGAARILDRDSGDPRVQEFWEGRETA
ncbi:NACHT domain-containing protein [Kitasatospora xanthocidica]|uniref:NACHT domain-containing protein n=1 Tax=Kitasatospora xanthocidica TaxID=83382 RepID=UPI001675CF8D|nr:hypothetical protein [Kitasatospora xanthocidica]